ncbi:MAG: peroxidase [Acidobacteria bacterium]|nr:peroxidase [Acidobacteriota bacterium]
MFLKDVQQKKSNGPFDNKIAQMQAHDLPVPEIWHLFAFKPEMTEHLSKFTDMAMRGPSPLSHGMRELIAAFTSRQNACPF